MIAALPARAGLRDIHPRPQQMGLLSMQALPLPGAPYLVVPDNPVQEEIWVQEEAQRLVTMRTGILPVIIPWSEYSGQSPSLWLGTLSRFPALRAALDSVDIAGLGEASHPEEYQLVVDAQGRILLGASDLRGLRWGLQSTMALMTEVMGNLYIERAYIRDWPDFPRRIGTLNGGLTIQSQADFAHRIVDLSYAARMNEIEWNSSGLWTTRIKPFALGQVAALRSKLNHYGQELCLSADATGKRVPQDNFQEGVAVRDHLMRVTASGGVPVANGYPIQIANGGFENWDSNRAQNWFMYRDTFWGYVTRDATVRHSGTSSLRMNGQTTGFDIRQHVYFGPNKMLRFRLWYRTADYVGKLRILMLSTETPRNRWEDRWLLFPTATTRDWTMVEFDFRSFSADSVLLILGPYEASSGTLWLDDVALETGDLQDVLRRSDTPVEVYQHRQNLLLAEGVDYRIVETDTLPYTEFVRLPRLERIAGGRLATGDTVRMNWYCASRINSEKQTPCFSHLGILEDYQGRIRRMDSLMHPDRFKIHINEVAFANCDPACTSRGMTPGQLVGSFCRQMYNIIQARRPGVPVRSYGDAFDIYTDDRRSMPRTPGPWNIDALQELPSAVEMMAMVDYSHDIDSTIIYFNQLGHSSVMAVALWLAPSGFIHGTQAARRQSGCNGVQFYMWEGDVSDHLLPARTMMVGELGWNMGPFLIHTPPHVYARPDTLRLAAEIWTDSLLVSTPVSITAATLHYRVLPSGSWQSTPLTLSAADRYAATVRNIASNATGLEYFFSATDHRSEVSTAPADAPQRTFLVSFSGGSSSTGGEPGGDAIEFSARRISGGTLLEWPVKQEAAWYEVHEGPEPDFADASRTRVARQRPSSPRFLIPTDYPRQDSVDELRVYAIQRKPPRTPHPVPERKPGHGH